MDKVTYRCRFALKNLPVTPLSLVLVLEYVPIFFLLRLDFIPMSMQITMWTVIAILEEVLTGDDEEANEEPAQDHHRHHVHLPEDTSKVIR